ncbi:hypothetical protein SLEP1_g52673 [Rubroshorea leprosula]|uniref:Uncharacterized protein n=1 Tax=Rubroshorea leprosula TaxID=152421 RepID=A0AAV5M9A4_9ROSI|nr:hypothetical protein SLEP1_g52673 [Rubroshorea leprosula]
MELTSMGMDPTAERQSVDPLQFARSYQLEALEKAIKQNTVVFLETGSGKTLIAVMLLRSYAYLFRKPSSLFTVFLVPQVVLVKQQAQVVRMHTDLSVGEYWGELGVDFWDAATWQREIDKHEVLVMTPAILLRGLRHSFFKINMIKVLIFDECHHASGNHPYASIMREFYHSNLTSGVDVSNLPRIFGMTASPIKSKGAKSADSYWNQIQELETIMNSKVYTCVNESVLAKFIPFSTPKFRFYCNTEIPANLHTQIMEKWELLKVEHIRSLNDLNLKRSSMKSTTKKIEKIHTSLIHCLDELGVWLALKAAQYLSSNESDSLLWGKLDVVGDKIVKRFSWDASQALAAHIPSGPEWTISDNVEGNVVAGLLTTKIVCLIESLLEYKDVEEIRCIIFVERVITAIVLRSLLSELLPKDINWKSEYIAGNNNGLQSQSRKTQHEIVQEFRKGLVNIIVATSILEEGLDVQSCNLVIRFDPSSTVCSFIQSRGRARMQNSHYVLMVKSGDDCTHSRLENYLASGDMMRTESLRHSSDPCSPLEDGLYEESYSVPSTGAVVTLSSSVALLNYYCSRLPSDGYFRPAPRFEINKEMGICTLHLPNSCPVKTVYVEGNIKNLKQKACLEACKKLYEVGALTDHLVPDIVAEEAAVQELGKEPYNDDQPIYFPAELVNHCTNMSETKYYCYLIELKQNFEYEVGVENIVLACRTQLENDIINRSFELDVNRGTMSVKFKSIGAMDLSREEILFCRRFQITLFRVLLDHKVDGLKGVLDGIKLGDDLEMDYLVLPSTSSNGKDLIHWNSVKSVAFSCEDALEGHANCNPGVLQTKSGPACLCMIQDSLVYTPHNGYVYCITGILNGLTANSLLSLRNGNLITYKEYYKHRHGIQLCDSEVSFLKGKHIFHVQNHLHRCQRQKEKEPIGASVELPPELCQIIMAPISASTLYSFTFIPSIMHRLESLLLAVNLKKMHLDDFTQDVIIPTSKVLEAITTKKCQENFHLESLETLGDSFLKYAVSQQLFKTYQNDHEGLLSAKREKIISNATLCKLGVDRKLPGFIRTEPFDPKSWVIPGDNSSSSILKEDLLPDARKIYVSGQRKVKRKTVADVVEALIGVYLSTGGESAALAFLNWIGIDVNFTDTPGERNFQIHAERHVNIPYFESLLNYSFRDPSLLVEALTHGSYTLSEIPICYQRLEFLGDSVLDYLITVHLYSKYPRMSPGLLTDMRSASVNNECYAHAAIRVELHKHILNASQDLHNHIVKTVEKFTESSPECSFGWESEISFPKALGDVIESLAGAIFLDSGCNKDIVFQSIRPLLEPLVTPKTVRKHPVSELTELCQREHFDLRKPIVSRDNGVASITVEVEAKGKMFSCTQSDTDRKTAKKLASKGVLQALKESLGRT